MSIITIKKLSDHYKILSKKYIHSTTKDGALILYHPTENGKYNVYKYMCHITKIKDGFYQVPGFEPTSNFETLLENIKAYTASMKYSSEFYSPEFKEGYFEYMVVHDYLKELGFKNSDKYFTLKVKGAYGEDVEKVTISIYGLDFFADKDELKKVVDIRLWMTDHSWISVKDIPRHPDNIIPEIEGLLKPFFLISAANDFKMSEKFKAKDLNLTKNELSGVNIVSEDYKEKLKKSLQEALDALK